MLLNFNFNKSRAPLLFGLLFLSGNPAWSAGAALIRARFLMGTVCEITAYGAKASEAVTAAFEEIDRLEKVMSTFQTNSELSRLNVSAASAPFPCSKDLWGVLQKSAVLYRASKGAFDPTYDSESPGFSAVQFDSRRRVRFLRPGLRINLGGIGKGYALDSAAAILRRHGIDSALLNFGGQILTVGSSPNASAWNINIEDSALQIKLKNASAATSSQSQQTGHIVDPRTRRTIGRNASVTVLAEDATSADGWSTALFVLGVDRTPDGFPGCAIEVRRGHISNFAGNCRKYVDLKSLNLTQTTRRKQ